MAEPLKILGQEAYRSSERQWVKAHSEQWGSCQLCPLGERAFRHVLYEVCNVVPTETVPIPLAFMGEAPGESEDTTGRPFIGKAGNVFRNAILEEERALGFKIPYLIFNTLACRSVTADGHDRPPEETEKDCCRPRVVELLKFFRPGLILCLGNYSHRSITKLIQNHGQELGYEPTVMKTWHPSHLMKNGSDQDIKFEFSERIRESLALGKLIWQHRTDLQ